MKTRLVLVLLVLVFMSLQAEVVIAESENGTVDSKLPEIIITSPAGGEVFVPEEIANISFEILEDSFAEPPVEPVSLQFYFDEVQNSAYNVNMTAAYTLFSYEWTVPDQLSENIYAKVTATDYYGNTAEAASDVFEIAESSIINYGDVPETTKLSAVYPNPFNPVTTIDYELAESGRVIIEVYNIKGQKIAVLADEIKDAGRYSLNWNAESCNSGIYFVRFSTSTCTEVKKAILLK